MTIASPMAPLCLLIGGFLQLSRHAYVAHMPLLEVS